jgi:hypothetical protein
VPQGCHHEGQTRTLSCCQKYSYSTDSRAVILPMIRFTSILLPTKILTAALPFIEGNVIDRNGAAGSVRTPHPFEHHLEPTRKHYHCRLRRANLHLILCVCVFSTYLFI